MTNTALPRTALRDGDRVWVMDDTDRLAIRDIQVAWRHRDRVLAGAGVTEGDRIVVSGIAAPIPGMKLMDATDAARAVEPSGLQPSVVLE